MNQLKKIGFSMASRCPFCGEAEEALVHLLIHYPKIWCMWSALFSLSRACWVCPFMVKDLFMDWPSLPLRKKVSKLWRAVPLCLMWAIWKERNRVVFEDVRFSISRLKGCFLRSFCSWASLIHDMDYSLVRFILCIL